MSYSIPCECGNKLEVTVAQAGTEISCKCGRRLSIPLLSKLRKMSGQEAYEAGIIDTINRMIRSGELPWGNTCAISGMPTSDSYTLYVQCESKWVKGPSTLGQLFEALRILTSPLRMIMALIGQGPSAEQKLELGRDRGVYAPLRVRTEYHDQLRRTRSQSKLRKLLCTVPIYEKLFEEFPSATITT